MEWIFVEDGLKVGNKVDVIAQESIRGSYYASSGMLAQQRSIANIFWGGLLLPENDTDSVISDGIGPSWISGNRSFINPTIFFNETLVTDISGIKIKLVHAPGETADNIIVWLPKKRVLFAGDNIYLVFPDLSSMTGAKYRDVPQRIGSLDKMRTLNASYLVPSHTVPVLGYENVTDVLNSYRDGIVYVYDQTVRFINKGLTPDELGSGCHASTISKRSPLVAGKVRSTFVVC